MECTKCGCVLVTTNGILYTHEKSSTLVPGNSLSRMVYVDKNNHMCDELWFGYYKDVGVVFTCVGYPHLDYWNRERSL